MTERNNTNTFTTLVVAGLLGVAAYIIGTQASGSEGTEGQRTVGGDVYQSREEARKKVQDHARIAAVGRDCVDLVHSMPYK